MSPKRKNRKAILPVFEPTKPEIVPYTTATDLIVIFATLGSKWKFDLLNK